MALEGEVTLEQMLAPAKHSPDVVRGVISAWARSFLEFSPFRKEPEALAIHRVACERVFAAGSSLCLATAGDGVWLGFAVYGDGGKVLHYAYTFGPYRRLGVARMMLERIGPVARYTHRTRGVRHLGLETAEYVPADFWGVP